MSSTPTSLRSPSRQTSASNLSRRSTAVPRNAQPSARSAPYMVALSGWPEPVYIDSQGVGAARSARSRSGTPRGSISGPSGDAAKPKSVLEREARAKAGPSAPAAERADQAESGSGHTTRSITPVPGPLITEALYPYLHSNTRPKSALASRTPPLATAPAPSTSSLPAIKPALQPRPSEPSPSPYRSSFADPRFTPHASVLGRHGGHLRVAPSWTGSVPLSASRVLLNTYDPTPVYSSIRTQHPSDREAEENANKGSSEGILGGQERSKGVGGRVLQLGSIQGKTQPVILRSTPEVYPLPHLSGGHGIGGRGVWPGVEPVVGVATEVYPRDPESMMLWPGVDAGREGARGSEGGSGTHTPVRPASPRMESAPSSARKRYPVSALSPEAAGGWSPTVPWEDEAGGEGGGGRVESGGGVAESEGKDGMDVDA